MARTSQLLARLGIAAAALTAPLAFPAPAKADPARHELWDRVALCESGGNWSANTGNGYYGGLQFSRSTWNSYGGGTYAGTANYATRLQQIAIAEQVRCCGWSLVRARCTGCGATHVLLPVLVLARRADVASVIGSAMAAKAPGSGHRRIAAELGRPAETVRGWLRRFTGRVEAVRVVFTGWCRALAADRGVVGAGGR